MMKYIFAVVALLLFSSPLWADEASSVRVEDWTYGNIYVKESNSQIALEKEYMYVTLSRIKAVFSFRNTTDSLVTLPCAFPVVIDLPYKVGDEYGPNAKVRSAIQEAPDDLAWAVAFGEDVVEFFDNDGCNEYYYIDHDKVKSLDKKLRVLTYDNYTQMLDSLEANGNWVNFVVKQDGRKVAINNVGIETNVKKSGVQLVLHFSHDLTFVANQSSIVEVEYHVNSLSTEYHGGNSYDFYYDISTGAKWKDGIIGDFVLNAHNIYIDGEAADEFDRTASNVGCIYSRKNYHPKGLIHFSNNGGSGGSVSSVFGIRFFSKDGASDLVTDIYAKNTCVGPVLINGCVSDSILQRNSIRKYYEEWPDYFVPSDYPEAEFDSIPVDGGRYYAIVPRMYIDSAWHENGRMKDVVLLDKGSHQVAKFHFEDCYPYKPYPISCDNLSPISLPILRAGRYRLKIVDYYAGTKNDEVAISGFGFYETTDEFADILERDRNSEMPLFAEVYKSFAYYCDDIESFVANSSHKDQVDDEENNNAESYVDQADNTNSDDDLECTDDDQSFLWTILGLLFGIILGIVVYLVSQKKKK